MQKHDGTADSDFKGKTSVSLLCVRHANIYLGKNCLFNLFPHVEVCDIVQNSCLKLMVLCKWSGAVELDIFEELSDDILDFVDVSIFGTGD